MKNIFKDILKGKVVIVGMGNILRGDDGFGPALIKRLSAEAELKEGADTVCFDVGTTPENYISRIAREAPETILIVDAVHLGLKPGEYELVRASAMVQSGWTTHALSPHMFMERLEKETGASIYILGIQPKNISFGEDLTDGLKKALTEITDLIKKAR